MPKKVEGTKSRRRAQMPDDSGSNFFGSPYSQQTILARRRFESDRQSCKANIALRESKLKTAEQGCERWGRQLSEGKGYAHSIFEGFIEEKKKEQGMISAFEDAALEIQARIDALVPSPEKAQERAERQQTLAGQLLARLEMDRKLDSLLEATKQILRDLEELTAKMREAAEALEFRHGMDLDGERFDALLRSLPKEMAQTSEKFVDWFLGREAGRCPRTITCAEAVLPETLRSANVFFYGERPELTAEEARAIDALDKAAHIPTAMEMEDATRVPGHGAKELPTGKVQWGLARSLIL